MKERVQWYSERLGSPLTLARWGWYGAPVLVFPTAGGDAEEVERRGIVDVLRDLLEAGKIKVYSCDSLAGALWASGDSHPLHCAWYQNRFDECVINEVVPAIRADCASADIQIVTAGASVGAFNALASLCRHPDVFRAAIGMSGTYDMTKFLKGEWSIDFYMSSPIHFLPNLQEGTQLSLLRKRLAVLATGEGRWEEPEQSWRMAHVLGAKGIPNRVDAWGTEFDHDWPTWRRMLPHYLALLD